MHQHSSSLSTALGRSCSNSRAALNSIRVSLFNWPATLIGPNSVGSDTTCSSTSSRCLSLCFLEGTFLGDNEAERSQMQLATKTVSLWSHLNRPEVLRSFLNPLYEPNQRVIWPSVAPMSLVGDAYQKQGIREKEKSFWVVYDNPRSSFPATKTAHGIVLFIGNDLLVGHKTKNKIRSDQKGEFMSHVTVINVK